MHPETCLEDVLAKFPAEKDGCAFRVLCWAWREAVSYCAQIFGSLAGRARVFVQC